MSKKSLYLLLLLALLTMSGLGCKGLSAEQKAAVKPVTLNYWTVYNDVSQLNKFVAEYKQLRPYVTVKVKRLRYGEFENVFVNALADDVPPDIISVHTRQLSRYLSRIDYMPSTVKMARIIDKSNSFKEDIEIIEETVGLPSLNSIKSNYVNTVYSDIVLGGRIYGLPLAIDTLAIYYNKDLLDKSGIPLPPTTWDEFVDAVKKSTKFDKDGRIIQSGVALGGANNIENFFDIFSLFLMQSGVKMAQGQTVTFTNGIENYGYSHPFFKALNFYTDFARPNKEAYCWNEEMGNAFDQFIRGKTVFYFGFGYEYQNIRSMAPALNVEIIPVPQLNKDNPSNVANYWVESVVKKSKHKNEAWDFIRFITSPEKVAEYTAATFRPSPLRSLINEQLKNSRMEPFVSQSLYAENWYDGRNIESAESAFKYLIIQYMKPYTGDPKKRLNAEGGLILDVAQRVQVTM